MGFKGAERGVGHVYIRKADIAEFPAWKGIRLDGDPASVNLNEFRVAENVRVMDDEVLCRGGQAQVEGLDALSGVPSGIWQPDPDLIQATTPKIFFTDDTTPNGFTPKVLRYESSTGVFASVQTGQIVTDNTAVLGRSLFYMLPRTGSAPKHRALRRADVAAISPATLFNIDFLDDLDGGPLLGGVAQGKLWIIYMYDQEFTPSNGRVYSYDGLVFQQEHAFSLADTGSGLFFKTGATFARRSGFCPYREGWLWVPRGQAGFPGVMLMVRDKFGSLSFHSFDLTSDSDLTPSTLQVNAMEVWSEYSRAVYIGGQGTSTSLGGVCPVIWRYEGGSPVLAHKINALGSCGSCISFDGFLYYAWQGAAQINIGRYDGSTWDDTFGVVAALLGGFKQLIPFTGSVYLFDRNPTVGIYKSAGTDLTVWSNVSGPLVHEAGSASVYSRYG